MQPGARFALVGARSDTIRIDERVEGDGDGYWLYWVGNVGWALSHPVARIHDVVARDTRSAALYETTGTVMLVEAVEERGAPSPRLAYRDVPAGSRRVVFTDACVFTASDAEVHALRATPEAIAMDAVDLAASPRQLAVIDPLGVTWFDEAGRFEMRTKLSEPTAIAYDARSKGWLLAADGDVLQLHEPGRALELVARGVGLVSRLRRGPRAIYAFAEGTLHEITDTGAHAIAAYAGGWADFDAGWQDLHVDEGNGVARFYVDTPCGCRTRTIRSARAGATRDPDGILISRQRQSCPVCGHEWMVDVAG
ncbi:MAG: hypothetical protein M3680_02035 [Myxococcota bacterium]|nr:hypothetical protein [Myxococcota bacterium]